MLAAFPCPCLLGSKIVKCTLTQWQLYLHHAGREDYVPFVRELYLNAGTSRECIAITILEDEVPEPDETFTISIVSFDASTVVIIRDDGTCIF